MHLGMFLDIDIHHQWLSEQDLDVYHSCFPTHPMLSFTLKGILKTQAGGLQLGQFSNLNSQGSWITWYTSLHFSASQDIRIQSYCVFKINRYLPTEYSRLISQGKIMTIFTDEFSNTANFSENYRITSFFPYFSELS